MWLSGDEAIAHVRACIWSTSLLLGSTLSMVARTALKIELEAASVHAQGRLNVPTPLPGRVLHRPTGAIPQTFLPGAEWDGRDGFENSTSSEKLPRFEVSDTELYARWPNPIPMPAPFDGDWPQLSQVSDAMTRCLGVSPQASVEWLIETWEDRKLKASKGQGRYGRYSFDEWEKADPNGVRAAHEFSDEGDEPIVLWADDVIALDRRVVLSSAWPRASAPSSPASSLTPSVPSSPAATAEPPKYGHDSTAVTKLAEFVSGHYATAAAKKRNRREARAAAEAHFGRRITEQTFRAAFSEAGIENPGGRPRKTREK